MAGFCDFAPSRRITSGSETLVDSELGWARFSVDSPGLRECFGQFMKVVSSIKSAKKRHPDCQVVRRRGKIYVINKTDPRYKARQG